MNGTSSPSSSIVLGTDGTLGGTFDLGISLDPAQDTSDPADFQLSKTIPGRGDMTGFDTSGNNCIFATDGTPARTTVLAKGSIIPRVFVLGGNLICESRSSQPPVLDSLWSIPELGGTPSLLLPGTSNQNIFAPVELAGRLLFAWRDQPAPGGTGIELWSTDGTAAGTGIG